MSKEETLIGYKFRLEPNRATRQQLAQYGGNCRFVYNWGLQQRKEYWKKHQKTLSFAEQCRRLTALKKEYEWLQLSPSQTLIQALMDLDKAFKNFFRRIKEGEIGKQSGYPRFKKKGRSIDAFRFPEPSGFRLRKLSRKKYLVCLPKLGGVIFRKSREIEGEIRNATVTREGERWYICFCVRQERDSVVNEGSGVGIDRGVVNTVVLYDGRAESFQRWSMRNFKELEARRRVKQSRMDRRKKVKFSRNWRAEQDAIAKLDRRMSRMRRDFNHQITTKLAKNHGIICLEDLKVKNMTKSARGTIEDPGKNVKAKSGLNRAILEQGWGQFEEFLKYKSEWYGSELILVDPKYTSQRCSECGHVEKGNRESQSRFKCKGCGVEYHADENAARNIYTCGQRGRALGDVWVATV